MASPVSQVPGLAGTWRQVIFGSGGPTNLEARRAATHAALGTWQTACARQHALEAETNGRDLR